MKSFLILNKKPLVKWGFLPDNVFFEGTVPESYSLAVCPSEGTIVLDVDKGVNKNGFENIPLHLLQELNETLNYKTKNDGKHFWFKYTGDKVLANKTSGLFIDLRTHKGYAVWYKNGDIRDNIHLIKDTSPELNVWLEKLFSYN